MQRKHVNRTLDSRGKEEENVCEVSKVQSFYIFHHRFFAQCVAVSHSAIV